MSLAPRSWIIERQLIDAVSYFWPGGIGVPEFLDSSGDLLTTLPALRVSFAGAQESPENTGNHLCEVDIELFGRFDPANATTASWGAFAENVRVHIEIAGYVEEWITASLAPADLETTVELYGFTNTLTVSNVRLAGFEADIDAIEGTLHHSWKLEIYMLQTATE